jgi:hypothetical protein
MLPFDGVSLQNALPSVVMHLKTFDSARNCKCMS